MKVLHDWDRLWIDGGWARGRGISLLCYYLSRKFKFLSWIKYFRENAELLEAEKLAYMVTLIKLNKLSGVTTIFGIRDIIRTRHGKGIDELAIKYELDIRRHIHIGEPPDPDRERLWDPPLPQPRTIWHFDTRWIKGDNLVLGPGELPVWHVDFPYNLNHYIDYLYEECVK